MSDVPFDPVGIVGLGLMGGSLAGALSALPMPPRVIGMARDEADREAAEAAGVVDRTAPDLDALVEAGVELLVYATPLSALLDLMPGHVARLPEDVVLTDVASLKAPVLRLAADLGIADRYVGSHPMTGGEGSGFSAARPTLYRGARIWLTEESGGEEARRKVEGFWRALEAEPEWISATGHDRRMVWASHLPQLVANALARSLDGAGLDPAELGPGGRDMTRLAASSASMWRDLVVHASAEDAAALHVMAGEIEAIAAALESGRFDEVRALMEETARWRRGGRHG